MTLWLREGLQMGIGGSGKPLDPRDPDYSREGIFQTHNCYECEHGKKPCPYGNPHQCEYPHARND